MRKQLEGTLALLLGTFICGMAFIAQSVGGELIGPFTFQAIRCLLGVIFLFLVSLLLERKAGLAAALQKWRNPKLWRGGITCGVALFAAAEGDAEELPAEAVAIRTGEDLDRIGYEYPLDGYYYLACDIDLTAATSRNGDYYNEGAGWLPIGTQSMPFTGTFDGCGFTITGLNINRPTGEKVGFFGAIKDASIKNVNFVNTNITGKKTVGLVGYASGASVISNIHSSNSAVTAQEECGGIAGAIETTGSCVDCSHS